MKIIPYGQQYIDNKDIKVVSDALRKKLITTGDQVVKFENKIKNFLNSKFSYTCNSGTSALFLALQSIEVKKNDTIIPITRIRPIYASKSSKFSPSMDFLFKATERDDNF